MVRAALAFLVLAFAVAPVGAQVLEPGGEGRVVEVIDGDTVVLEDGEEVRLVGMMAPKLSLGRAHVPTEPLAEEAKAALEDLVLGRVVTLSFGGERRDRHGRTLAHLHDEAGRWIQGAMIEAGLGRVYSFPDNRALVAEMLALETRAREAGRGLWADPYFAVLAADEDVPLDRFVVVEGVIVDAADVDGRVYLNFGADWRTDFTVSIGRKAATVFADAGVDPLALAVRRVRVRGWTTFRNGPMIDLSHPEPIEVLDP
jgi:endonuclease YncB( thermonuclease family)